MSGDKKFDDKYLKKNGIDAHETGGLRYNGETKNEINDKMYTRSGHTSNNVPYYVHINPNKSIDTKNIFSPVIDNTDIFRLCKSCLNV